MKFRWVRLVSTEESVKSRAANEICITSGGVRARRLNLDLSRNSGMAWKGSGSLKSGESKWRHRERWSF